MKYIDPIRGAVSEDIPVQCTDAFAEMTRTMLAWSPPSREARFECSEMEWLRIEDAERRQWGRKPIGSKDIGTPTFRGVPIIVRVTNVAEA